MIDSGLQFSRQAHHWLSLQPDLIDVVRRDDDGPFARQEMESTLAEADVTNAAQLRRAVIDLRRRVWLHTMARECSGMASLGEAVAAYSDFAETVIAFALEKLSVWQHEKYGLPVGDRTGQQAQMSIIALSNLGGRELGPGCEADLVFVYDEEGRTDGRRRIGNRDYFCETTRQLIEILGDGTDGGFALRIYTGLRPHGSQGALACDAPTLENWFARMGDEATRSAWIRARVLTGTGELIKDLVQPFVFRRFLDYSVYESIREIHRRLRDEIAAAGLELNIRHGPGGLREVEFIVNTFQLTRGGRDSRLRTSSLTAALEAMSYRRERECQHIDKLRQAHDFLRSVEHRLQYLDDDGNHSLPLGSTDLRILALSMGQGDVDAFVTELAARRRQVQEQFEQFFAGAGRDEMGPLTRIWLGDIGRAEATESLREAGFESPEPALDQLRACREEGRYGRLPSSARQQVDRLVPQMLMQAVRHPPAHETWQRLANLLESAAAQPAYVALLAENPRVLESLARFCAASPWIASYLARHPLLIDELLRPDELQNLPDRASLERALAKQLDREAAGNSEQELETLIDFRQAQTFHLVACELLSGMPVKELGHRLSEQADIILQQALDRQWRQFLRRHAESPHFAVIAYGKLGGRELGYASDLDLVFLYRDDDPEAQENYMRFGRRLAAWMGTNTSAGMLYEIDLRLRPDGDSGLIACSLAAFEEYQRRRAWVWEHQALTRARFVAGDADAGQYFEMLRRDLLCQPRNATTLATEVTTMRKRMADGHRNSSSLFDLKHDPGGLVDVEFAVQFLVLAHAAEHPDMVKCIGTTELLVQAGELGLIPAPLATAAGKAYENLRQLQHDLRLQGAREACLGFERVTSEIDVVRELWLRVFAPYGV